ncbi:type II toxin-antitoxin system Phd/YefM family antitoxin [bacterium]|nr:type II toxin-antitoxin system Phd/YefM family antitoxin [bacterium]
MKHYSATEARKNFFSLLDDALEGNKVYIEREGHVLELLPKKKKTKKLSYKKFFLSSPSVDDADTWGWEWKPDSGLHFINKKRKK